MRLAAARVPSEPDILLVIFQKGNVSLLLSVPMWDSLKL